MRKVIDVFKGIGYIMIAIAIISLVVSGGLAILAVMGIVTVVGLIGLLVWFVAALIKEQWDSRKVLK